MVFVTTLRMSVLDVVSDKALTFSLLICLLCQYGVRMKVECVCKAAPINSMRMVWLRYVWMEHGVQYVISVTNGIQEMLVLCADKLDIQEMVSNQISCHDCDR